MTRLAGIVLGLFSTLAVTTAAQEPQPSSELPVVRFGVVIDGTWERTAEVERVFQGELLELLRGEFDPRFPEGARRVGDWSVEAVDRAFDQLLADETIDVVLAMGIIASDRALRRRDLEKPVIAPFVIDAEIQAAPREGRASGVGNLSYLSSSITFRRDLEMFQELRPFERLVVLHGPSMNAVPGIRDRLREVGGEFDVELSLVEVRARADEALSAIPANVDAVFVNPLLQLEAGELEKLAQGLIERGLPSFSRLGRSEVERGLLMSLTEDVFARRARRTALNVQRALLGEDPATFPVDFVMREELVINMATARAINVFPSFALETIAQVLNGGRPEQGRRLTIEVASDRAVASNLDLKAFDREVAANAENIGIAKSSLGPQVDLSFQASAIDSDRASATGLAQYLASPALTVSQLIFADGAWANKRIQEHFQSQIEWQRETLSLDIVREAATAYLNVMRALTRERVQRENLDLSRSNLELAKVREAIGSSGFSEVYRWEAQIASDQNSVIQASAERNLAEIELNRLLNYPLEDPFATVETGVDDPVFLYVRAQFYPYISSREYFDISRDAFALIALSQAPELQAIDELVAARHRSLLSASRAFYLPEVFVQGSVDYGLRGGAGGLGAFQSLGALFPDLELTAPNDTNWSVGVDLSLPLFTSGNRPAVKRQDQELLSQLSMQRASTAQRIEARIRRALHSAGASYAGIRLARDAASASSRNLELVTDSYSRGAVSVIQLLDAQNASVLSEEAAANAVYTFLIDMLEVERALGKFYFRSDAMQIEVLFEQVDQVFIERGRTPPSRLR